MKKAWKYLTNEAKFEEVKNIEKGLEIFEKALGTRTMGESDGGVEFGNPSGNSNSNLTRNTGNGIINGVSNTKSEQYGVMWTLESGALDNNEVSAFYEKISETKNNKYQNYHKASNGQLIYEIGDKLVYTDGDYDYPQISKTVAFNTKDRTIIEYGKECVYDGEKYGLSLEESLEIGSIVYGKEIATITSFNNSETHGGKIGNGEGTDSTEINSGSRKNVKNDIQFSSPVASADTKVSAEAESDVKIKSNEAKNYYDRYSNTAKKDVGKLLGIPKSRLGVIDGNIDTLAGEYFHNGKISEESKNALFEKAWKEGIVIDDINADLAKDLRKELKSSKLYISPDEAKDIPDFGAWRKSQIGNIKSRMIARAIILQ